jgi:hypothetical protein
VLEVATNMKEAKRDLFIPFFWGWHPFGFDMEFWVELKVSIFRFMIVSCKVGFDMNVSLKEASGFFSSHWQY